MTRLKIASGRRIAYFRDAMRTPTGRRWVFTLMGDTAPAPTGPIRYGVWQLECAPSTGQRHWQGFIIYTRPLTFAAVKRSLGSDQVHVELARGSSQQCRDYCTKEETRCVEQPPIEVGEFPEHNGKRNDWDDFLQAVRDQATDEDLWLQFPGICLRCPAGVTRAIQMFRNLPPAPKIEWLYEWQAKLLEEIKLIPHPRKVIWYVDHKGNTGKTWLGQLLVRRDKADFYTGGRQQDCAYACFGSRIQLFDLSRERAEYFSYDFLEQVKNGAVFSTKYESGRKLFPVPHVIVFSNWEPDMEKLSMDRWDIRRLGEKEMKNVVVDGVVIQ